MAGFAFAFWVPAIALTALVVLWAFAPLARAGQPRLALAVSLATALLALAAYLAIGHPDLPDQPVAPRLAARAEALAQIEAGVATLRATLAAQPNDPQGWALLATSEAALGHDEASAIAFERAAALATGDEKDGYAAQAAAARQAVQYKAGLAAEAAGDRLGMERAWRPLVDALPDAAPLRAELLQKLDAPR